MHEPLYDALQPRVGIVSAQEGVAGVEVDADLEPPTDIPGEHAWVFRIEGRER